MPAFARVRIQPAHGDARRRRCRTCARKSRGDDRRASRATRCASARRARPPAADAWSRARRAAAPRAAPPTSSITTRGVCVRSARNSVWPVNGMPASIITLFCIGAVTSAANAPVAQASVRVLQHRQHAVRVGRIGAAGRDRRGERLVPDFDDAAGGRERDRIVSRHSAASRPMRAARCASSSRSPRITSRAANGACAWRIASIAHSSGPMPAGSPDRDRERPVVPASRPTASRRARRRVAPELASSRRAPRGSRACRRRRRRCAPARSPSSAVGGLAEHPQQLERVRRRRSRPCAGPRGRAAARSLRARTPGNWSSFAR